MFPVVLFGVVLCACGGETAEAPDGGAPGGSGVAASTETSSADGNAAPAEERIDACSVITPAELESASGRAFDPGVSTAAQLNINRCAFSTPDRRGALSIAVYVRHADDTFEQYRGMPGMQPVEGMDSAYASATLDTFVVRKGERVLVLDWRGLENPGRWIPGIARRILERI